MDRSRVSMRSIECPRVRAIISPRSKALRKAVHWGQELAASSGPVLRLVMIVLMLDVYEGLRKIPSRDSPWVTHNAIPSALPRIRELYAYQRPICQRFALAKTRTGIRPIDSHKGAIQNHAVARHSIPTTLVLCTVCGCQSRSQSAGTQNR